MRIPSLLFLLAMLTSGFVFGPIGSHTFIAPGRQFVLGGQQKGAFNVQLRNSGLVPLSVAERRADGTVRECGQLEPRQTAELSFDSGSAALVRNLGNVQAEFEAYITGYTKNLGMKYEVMVKE